jgi:hypothetical protein
MSNAKRPASTQTRQSATVVFPQLAIDIEMVDALLLVAISDRRFRLEALVEGARLVAIEEVSRADGHNLLEEFAKLKDGFESHLQHILNLVRRERLVRVPSESSVSDEE